MAGVIVVPSGAVVALPWRQVCEAWVVEVSDSPATRAAYRRYVAEAMTHLGVAEVAEVTPGMLMAYRAWVTERYPRLATQRARLIAVRSFLRWCAEAEVTTLAPAMVTARLRLPKGDDTVPYEVVTDSEAARMLDACWDDRSRALVAVLLGTGARISEVVGLTTADLRLDDEVAAVVVRGKGNRRRVVPVGADLADLLRTYAATRPAGACLFPAYSRRSEDLGRPMSRGAAYDVVRRVAGHAAVRRRVCPHGLRHTYATRSLRHRPDLFAVSRILGHANVATTNRYVNHLGLADLASSVPPLPRVARA